MYMSGDQTVPSRSKATSLGSDIGGYGRSDGLVEGVRRETTVSLSAGNLPRVY
jgi:hypothetical protein